MFSLLDLQFGLWSLDLHILHKQMILGSFIVITHKSTRLENSITWIIWEEKKIVTYRFHGKTGSVPVY